MSPGESLIFSHNANPSLNSEVVTSVYFLVCFLFFALKVSALLLWWTCLYKVQGFPGFAKAVLALQGCLLASCPIWSPLEMSVTYAVMLYT